MKKALKIILLVVGVLVLIGIGAAIIGGISPISFGIHSPVYTTNGLALDGYDVISYFEGSPTVGNEEFSSEWRETKWLFISEAHKNEFIQNPTKYAPQFGGYCSFAVSTGFTAPGDPTIFTISNDQLFIFSNEEVKAEFLKDPTTLIDACNAKWKE